MQWGYEANFSISAAEVTEDISLPSEPSHSYLKLSILHVETKLHASSNSNARQDRAW